MIARAIVLFLIFAFVFFTLYWTVFRTRFFNASRLAEIAKTTALVVIAIASAIVSIVAITNLDKLF